VRWIAPILSFTADEIWQVMPGERSEFVFLETYYEGLQPMAASADMGRDFWNQVMDVKEAVNKEIEAQRNAGAVKGSLTTEVTLFCEAELQQILERLGEELRFVTITSEARVKPLADADAAGAAQTEMAGLRVLVTQTAHTKCTRCWHHREDVGSHAEHPELCGRCVENVAGVGEKRQYA